MKHFHILLVISLIFTFPVIGEAFGPEPKNGFEVAIGPGVKYAPLYPGSDKHEVLPYPYVNIEYVYESLQLYAGLKDGIGFRFNSRSWGLFMSSGVDMGQGRDPGDDRVHDLLKNTPVLKNIFLFYGLAGWEHEYGEFYLRMDYFPVNADYSDGPDRKYDAMLFTPILQSGYPITGNLLVLLNCGISFMNSDYAAAYHGNLYETEQMKVYHAESGVESINSELMVLYTLTESFILRFSMYGKRLLGDASDSPYTRSNYQYELNMTLMYYF